MEPKEKFFLDSFILDGQSFKEKVARGNKNVFFQKDDKNGYIEKMFHKILS